MFAWGDNRSGQLGEGESVATTNVLTLTQVVTLTNLFLHHQHQVAGDC